MKNILKLFLVIFSIGALILQPTVSYADWNHGNGSGHNGGSGGWHGHDGGWHNHDYVGVNFNLLPDDYYYSPAYYPPPDVLVSASAYQPVDISGTTYYINNGSYYVYNGYGYEPVQAPMVVSQPAVPVIQPAVATAVADNDAPDSITINIPNKKGSYTAVTLKKSGNGFTGPQGEFYPEFPKVAQLQVIYGS